MREVDAHKGNRSAIRAYQSRAFGQAGAYDDCLRLNAGYRWTNNLEQAVERLGALARIAVTASE